MQGTTETIGSTGRNSSETACVCVCRLGLPIGFFFWVCHWIRGIMQPMRLLLTFLSSSDIYQCIPASQGNPPILAFAGTQNWRDVRDDVDVRPCPWPNETYDGRLHCGIARRTMRLWEREEDLRRFVTAAHPKPMVVTGYSLGGATSIALAAMLHDCAVCIDSVHTFGAPRVGDEAFSQWYDANCPPTFRYVTPRDIVPKLPIHYYHVGQEIVVPCKKRRTLQHHQLSSYVRGVHAMRKQTLSV